MPFLSLISLLIIILAFISLFTLAVVFFGSAMIYANIATRVPWARIPMANLEQIFVAINLPAGSIVYDLGCGDGRFLFLAEKKGFRAIGYELSFYPYLKAVFARLIRGSKVEIKYQDFFKQDLSHADAVFIFLTASVMDKIGRKLKKELRLGTRVVSYGFIIPGWPTPQILSTAPSKTYVY
jgi:SAM-dependent methyltransferase